MKRTSMRAVFISHAHADREVAEGVIKMIETVFRVQKNQILCTSVDSYGLIPGDNTSPKLLELLSSAHVVLGLLTRNSLLSSWVTMELGAGWGLGKEVLPVLFDVSRTEIPGPLSGIIAGDGRKDNVWPGILDKIRVKSGWEQPAVDLLRRAISDFVSCLPAPRKPLASQDLDIIRCTLLERENDEDAHVRLLEGPIQNSMAKGVKRWDISQFLITESETLCKMYAGALDTGPYRIPYKEVEGVFLPKFKDNKVVTDDVPIKFAEKSFVLESQSISHKLFQVQAFAQMIRSKLVDSDYDMVRLASVAKEGGRTTLVVQKAKYSDQVQSNLVLNWEGGRHDWLGCTGLQRPLQDGDGALKDPYYPNLHTLIMEDIEDKQLPEIGGNRYNYLGNTIGVSVILFCNVKNKLYPIINDRHPSKKRAIFQRGWTSTASFALKFKTNKERCLSALVEPSIKQEIQNKTNIPQNAIAWLAPVALCREFQRGGKPQLFYVGCIKDKSLTIDKVQVKLRSVEGCINVHDPITSTDLDARLLRTECRELYTSEFIANWYFAKHHFVIPFLEQRKANK